MSWEKLSQRESLLQRTGVHAASQGGVGCGKETVPSKSPDCGHLDVERKCDHFRKRPQVAWMGPGGGNQKQEGLVLPRQQAALQSTACRGRAIPRQGHRACVAEGMTDGRTTCLEASVAASQTQALAWVGLCLQHRAWPGSPRAWPGSPEGVARLPEEAEAQNLQDWMHSSVSW